MSAVVEVTQGSFAEEVLQSNIPTVVDYWADWCGPCKQLSPILDELAGEYAGRVKFVKINSDENPDLAQSQSVMSLPTVQLYVAGQVESVFQGAKPKSALIKLIEDFA
jgi:thioredoxin 1